jgi:diamine N-acetyltransferase
MEKIQIDGQTISMEPFNFDDKEKLLEYFNNLSQQSKKRYGPHPFTLEAIENTFEDAMYYKMFVAKNSADNTIIAYTVVKMGWVDFDKERLHSYDLSIGSGDATIAPSVADNWQGKGLGSKFFKYVIDCLKTELGITRLILWGGVQSDNEKAVRLYKKFHFKFLGEFEHNGMNRDMMLAVNE